MSTNNQQVFEFFVGWKTLTKSWAAFDSHENEDALLQLVAERGGPLSSSAFDVAFRLAKQSGRLTPVGSAPSAPANAGDIQRQAEAIPLDKKLYEQIQQMSKREVSERYFSDQLFHAIYDRANLKWGFQVPQLTRNPQPAPRPRPVAPASTPEAKPVPKTADEYYRLPASEVVRRYRDRSEPAFKESVDSLISRGLI